MNKTYTLLNPYTPSKRSTSKLISDPQKPDVYYQREIDPPDEIITYLIRLSQTLDVVKTQQAGEMLYFSN